MEEFLKAIERKCQEGVDKSKSMPWAKDFLIEVLTEIEEMVAEKMVFGEEVLVA